MPPIVWGRVDRCWPDSTIVCVGSGPSLHVDDLTRLDQAWRDRDDLRILAVNTAYTVAPADVLYAADAQWWQWHQHVDDARMPSRLYTVQPPALAFRSSAILLKITQKEGLADSPDSLANGGHGGYQAINLAVHLGAKTIILLGYDLLPMVDADGTVRHHFHTEYPSGSHPTYRSRTAVYATLLAPLAARQITIVNASRRTAISAIPQWTLAAALAL